MRSPPGTGRGAQIGEELVGKGIRDAPHRDPLVPFAGEEVPRRGEDLAPHFLLLPFPSLDHAHLAPPPSIVNNVKFRRKVPEKATGKIFAAKSLFNSELDDHSQGPGGAKGLVGL